MRNQLPSSFRQPHSVHSPPGSPRPAHITSSVIILLSHFPSVFYFRLKTHMFQKSFPDNDNDVYFTLATSNSRIGKYRTVVQ